MIADCTADASGPPPADSKVNGSTPARCFLYVESALDDAGLSTAAFRVLCNLSRRLGRKDRFPSAENIAAVCRVEKKTVFRALKELEERGAIVRTSRPGRPTEIEIQHVATWGAKRVDPISLPGGQTGQGVVGQTGREVTQKAPHEGNTNKVIQEGNPDNGDLALELDSAPVRKKDPKCKTAYRLPVSPEQHRFNKIMGRKPTTKWSPDEVADFKALGEIDPSDLEAVETFYLENQTNEKAYLRTSMGRLLRHFAGEVDKARAWERTSANPTPAHNQPIKF